VRKPRVNRLRFEKLRLERALELLGADLYDDE
jgi:hypothetical protein